MLCDALMAVNVTFVASLPFKSFQSFQPLQPFSLLVPPAAAGEDEGGSLNDLNVLNGSVPSHLAITTTTK